MITGFDPNSDAQRIAPMLPFRSGQRQTPKQAASSEDFVLS
jgi:hypothetical protein